ncbi:YgjV family protein [Fluviibacterium sp. DFM31]|uniref:YgjV family protein n=1 Tax=Meridianimarinicoccus marinus TaxID=3231483 RepID=A0ABV3L986_9RHOB
MTIGIDHMMAPGFSPVFGFAGLAAQFAWPFFRKRDAILTVQLGAACSYATSYALMGQKTATAVCLLGAIQTTVALLAGDRAWLSRLGYAFLPVVLTVGAVTYSGLPTLLAVAACCLVMIGRMQQDTLRMRGIQLTASPFGAAHDLFVGAWPNLMGAVVSFVIAFTAFRRELRESRQHRHPA